MLNYYFNANVKHIFFIFLIPFLIENNLFQLVLQILPLKQKQHYQNTVSKRKLDDDLDMEDLLARIKIYADFEIEQDPMDALKVYPIDQSVIDKRMKLYRGNQ